MAAEAQRIMTLSLGKIVASRSRKGGISLHRNLLVASVLFKARDAYIKECGGHHGKSKPAAAPAPSTTPAAGEVLPTDVTTDNIDCDMNSEQSAAVESIVSDDSVDHEPAAPLTSSVFSADPVETSNAVVVAPDCPVDSSMTEWSDDEPDDGKENLPPAEFIPSGRMKSEMTGLRCRKRVHVDNERNTDDLEPSSKMSKRDMSEYESPRSAGSMDTAAPDTTTTTSFSNASELCPSFRDNVFSSSSAYQAVSYSASTSISCSNLLDSLPMPILVMQEV